MVPPLAKGNGRNKRMIRSIYTYFQSVITDPCTGMVWKKKEEQEEEEEDREERRESWPRLAVWHSPTTGQGRDVQLATFFISASKPKRRWDGGAGLLSLSLFSLVCVPREEKEAEGGGE